MDEQQANELAARIREHFPHVSTVVVQSADMRNAPSNWLIGVQRRESLVEGISLHIHNELEWIEAVQALYVLQPPYKQAEPKQDYDPATGLWRKAAKQEPRSPWDAIPPPRNPWDAINE